MQQRTVGLRSVLLVVAFLVSAGPGSASALEAELPCEDETPFEGCVQEIARMKAEETTREQLIEKENEAKVRETGVDPFGGQVASTLKNFLPLFSGLFALDSVAEDGESVTVDVNPFGTDNPAQIQAVLRKPEVYANLLAEVPEEMQGDVRAKLESDFDDFDDFELNLSYSLSRPEGSLRTTGDNRLPSSYARLFSLVVDEAAKGDYFQAVFAVRSTLNPFLPDDVEQDPAVGDYRASLNALCKEKPDHEYCGRGLDDLLHGLAEEHLQLTQSIQGAIDDYFEPFAALVNNRSQFYLTAARRFRPDLAGPDTFTASVTYELGLWNVRTLRKKADCLTSETCAKNNLLEKEMGEMKELVAANAGNRLKFSFEYTWKDSIRLQGADLPDFAEDSATDWTASLGYGRYLGSSVSAPRLDLEVVREDFDSDTNRQDRWVGKLTFSRKLTESFSLPVGIVYANHERYLGDVRDQLSAHIGVNYRLPWEKE